MQFYFAGYSSSPAWEQWDSKVESSFWESTRSLIRNIDLVELPFCGSFHPHDDNWFFESFQHYQKYIYTAIPGIMNRAASEPKFGLASNDNEGRRSAIEFVRKLYECCLRFYDKSGGSQIVAIELQSAPSRLKCDSSWESYSESLGEIFEWDWGETEILLEHCDAFMEGYKPSKGFLSLEDEVKALTTAAEVSGRKNVGMVLNWARSVIEGRSTDVIYQHIDYLVDRSLLRGFCFSGVAEDDAKFGAWFDSHMPHSLGLEGVVGEPNSLLNLEHIEKTIDKLNGSDCLGYMGVKISPKNAGSIESKVRTNLDLLERLRKITSSKNIGK